MRHFITSIALFSLFTASVFAQQGDGQDLRKQIDPIPAEKIPPAPHLSVKEAMKTFQLAPGFTLESVAAEPHTDKVVAIDFDGNGRIWTVEMRGYMLDIDAKTELKPVGRIRILEDTNKDGKIDTAHTFIDGLVIPRAIRLAYGGVIYSDGDKLLFMKRNGLKPSGEPQVIDAKYAAGGNTEHKANGMIRGLNGWFYNAKSRSRYRLHDGKWEKQITNFRGQWGIDRDNLGHLYHNSNSTTLTGDIFPPNFFRGNPKANFKVKHAPRLGSNAVFPSRINPGVNRAYQPKILNKEGYLINATGTCGPVIYRGDNFPASKDGQALSFIAEPCGNLIKAVAIKRNGNSASGSHPYGKKEFLTSTDERFRPVNLYTAPDGTLYVVDMYFGLLQHKTFMTTYLRKQYTSRKLDGPTLGTGRIYRVRWKNKPAGKQPAMEGKPTSELVQHLAHPNGWWRDTAQFLIMDSGDASVTPALNVMATSHKKPLAQMHAIATLAGLGQLRADTLLPSLAKPHATTTALLDIISTNRNIANRSQLVSAIEALGAEQSLRPHVARALGSIATNKAHTALLKLLTEHGKEKFVKEAAVSGLAGQEAAFQKLAAGQYTNQSFIKNLEKSRKAKGSTAKKLTLQGKHKDSYLRGQKHYLTTCMACHGTDGTGMANMGPPLEKSEWVKGDQERLVKIMLHGLYGPLNVNGKHYKPAMTMPGLVANPQMTDPVLADIATYIRHAWGNKSNQVTADQVKQTRAKTKAQNGQAYKASDLQE